MQYALALLLRYRYAFLFPLAAFEGPIISLIVGFLTHQGYFNFFYAYGILIFGDIIPDIFYYYIGRTGNKNKFLTEYRSKLHVVSENIEHIERLWHYHGKKTMFFSKLAYGLSTPMLISAGIVKLPFPRFLSLALPITLIQYALFMTIGYYLGASVFERTSNYLRYGEIVVSILVLVFVLYHLLAQASKNQITKMDAEK
ncbi:MAG: DedA family protein [Patescibacteria group bacterium]|nr:DedA family protein [Patescibacteria group bacterium]MDE2438861.1 DedA family protein [Patescibacteria group bacterium]